MDYNRQLVNHRGMGIGLILLGLILGCPLVSFAEETSVQYIVKLSGSLKGTLSNATSPRLSFKKEGYGIQESSSEYVVVTIPQNGAEDWVETMKQVNGVEAVEPNYPVQISNSPAVLSDPLISGQSYLFKATILPALQIVPQRLVKVAVVDTGVDRTHPDLHRQIAVNTAESPNGIDDDHNGLIDDIYGYSFYNYSQSGGSASAHDVHGHGTHIAGIIAATGHNGLFGAGINPSARIIPVAFMDSAGRGTQFDAAAAIKYAADMGAEVINCSWGYFIYSGVLADAVEYARSKGALVVAASGNDGGTFSEFPASFDSVISVGSCGLNGNRSSFSNHNSAVDVLAYGESILSILPSGRSGSMTGTSQAAGIVSGIMSRLLSALPTGSHSLDPMTQWVQIQSLSPSVIDTVPFIQSLGISTADVVVAMSTEANGITPMEEIPDTTVSLTSVLNFPNPVKNGLTQFGFTASTAGEVTIRIFDLGGRRLKMIEESVIQGYNALSWDLVADDGRQLDNGTYLYIIDLSSSHGTARSRGKLTVLR